MLSRILAIFSVSLIVTKAADGAPSVARARQFLPAIPGYVPVYIRNGDTPLEEINSDLAEAFNSYSLKHARQAFGRSHNEIAEKSYTEIKADPLEIKEDIGDVSLGEDLPSEGEKAGGDNQQVPYRFHHIQKIPKP